MKSDVNDCKNGELDCIICGYNDTDYAKYATSLASTQKYSGAYHTVLSNSVLVQGERVPYMELLNRSFKEIQGRSPNLHVCRLPNLGVTYLRNYLLHWGLKAELVNYYNVEQDRLLRLLAMNPACLAITTTFYTTPTPIAEIVEFVRAHNKNVKIVVGGPYVFNLCAKNPGPRVDATLDRIGADIYVLESQGERTLVDVIKAVQSNGSLEEVPNLIYRAGASSLRSTAARSLLSSPALRRTRREAEHNDMDTYSIDWRRFPDAHFVPTVQLRTARSCAYKCAFCCYPIMAGELSLTSLDVVEKELTYLRSRGVKNVVFIDDTFNIPQNRFKDLCRLMIKNRYDFRWYSYFRAANADREAIALAAESGCAGVFLGIESGDQGVLNAMNKAVKVEKYVSAIKELNRLGVFTFVSLIVGFPGETAESVSNSQRFLEEAQPAGYRAELYFHSTNTPIHAKADDLQIRGEGYNWAHSTMDWKEAVHELRRLYASVTCSPVVAEHMFDFWSMPYLIGQGLTQENFSAFLRAAHPLLLRSMSDTPFDVSPYMQTITEKLAGVSLRS